MASFEIRATIVGRAELRRALDQLRYPQSSLKRILRQVGKLTIQIAKRDHLSGRPGLVRRTGKLQRSLKRDDTNLPVSVGVYTDHPGANVQEFGAVIRPTTRPHLVFRTPDGQWRRAKQVRVPARPFLEPAIEKAAEEVPALFDKEFARALKR